MAPWNVLWHSLEYLWHLSRESQQDESRRTSQAIAVTSNCFQISEKKHPFWLQKWQNVHVFTSFIRTKTLRPQPCVNLGKSFTDLTGYCPPPHHSLVILFELSAILLFLLNLLKKTLREKDKMRASKRGRELVSKPWQPSRQYGEADINI